MDAREYVARRMAEGVDMNDMHILKMAAEGTGTILIGVIVFLFLSSVATDDQADDAARLAAWIVFIFLVILMFLVIQS